MRTEGDRRTLDVMTPDDVLDFWFGQPKEKWFAKDAAFDALLRERFGGALEDAARGDLDGWKATPRGRVALVVLLDQLSRNIFRGTPRSFAQDSKALALALEGLDNGDAAKLAPLERYFLVMPLMHAEDMAMQRRCITELEKLRAEAPSDLEKLFDDAIRYGGMHAAIIERFGRFPHRNAVLGRASTAEEEAFLREPGSSF